MAEGGGSQRVNDAIVVFARLDSSRLPGKALKPIAGKLLIDRVIARCRAVASHAPVIVATSDRVTDDPIADHVRRHDLPLFRGAAEDVAGRALACAEEHGLDLFVRISGDSPFIDPALIDRCLTRARGGKADLVTNVFPRTYPAGVSVEAISVAAMRRIVEETDDGQDREHVTRYAYRRADRFEIENLEAPDDRYAGLSLSVDTSMDHAKASWIFETRGDDIDLDTAAAAAREWQSRQSEAGT
jgi:spore coat polysaccharide biosynthesis protein SpsF